MGTKMTLKRHLPVSLDWDNQEIIVDQEFITNHGLNVPVKFDFQPNLGLIEVYLQGQLLHSGGGYEELLDNSIRLDLGKDPKGEPIPLEIGEELFIKVYKNQYQSRGGDVVSSTDIVNIKREILEVKTYLEIEGVTSITTTINERFESLRREFEYDEFGEYSVTYSYNLIGKIETETVTKGDGTTRTFTYEPSSGKIVEEKYVKGGKTLTKMYKYNIAGKIEEVTVSTS